MAERNLAEVLAVAKAAAEEAGKFIAGIRSGGPVEITYKGERDLLTAADLGAEKIILTAIRDAFPDDAILSEEASPTLRSKADYLGPLWIIDPVDGTTNFAQGHHQVGVSIAFAEGGETKVGVVAAPFLEETFTAIRGEGAWLNGKRIRVSAETNLRRGLIGTGFPYVRDNIAPLVKRLARVLSTCRDLRRLGAASLDLSWVACGRLEGFYETLMPWDVAAGLLVAREAGAAIGRIDPLPPGTVLPEELCGEGIICACPGIFAALSEQLRLPEEEQ